MIAKFVFLIVLEKAKDCSKVWEEAPFYMNRKMILAIPWEPNFGPKTTRMTTVLVWVNLITLNLVFEDDVECLLGLVGSVMYLATKYAHSKYSNVRGCMKVDLTQPLQDFVVANVPGIGIFKINVEYRTLSDACFSCRKRGHLIPDCATLRLAEEEDLKQ